MERTNLEAFLRASLQRDIPYIDRAHSTGAVEARAKVIEARGRQAAVLALLGFRSGGVEAELLITRRADHLLMHAGQMAFPGGAADPEDAEDGKPSPVRTALRESSEEVGLSPEGVKVIGQLPPLFTFASDFWVTPVVGILNAPIEDVELVPSANEIAEVLWVPIRDLTAPGTHQTDPVEFGGRTYQTHVYKVSGQRIWGATAAMIHNLLQRLPVE